MWIQMYTTFLTIGGRRKMRQFARKKQKTEKNRRVEHFSHARLKTQVWSFGEPRLEVTSGEKLPAEVNWVGVACSS